MPLDASHPLSRSATIAIAPATATRPPRELEDDLPIANRMAKRSQTLRTNSPSHLPGLTRSLTISNPDTSPPISPARHARSKTVDEASIYSSTDRLVARPPVRPVRPRIVIPSTELPMLSQQSARYPNFPNETDRLQPPAPAYTPSSRPSVPRAPVQPQERTEYLQTPRDEYRTPLDEIYDNYRSPTPELEADLPEMPYTAIGQAFTTSPMPHSPSPIPSKPPSSYRPPIVTRSDTVARSKSNRSNTTTLSRSGSMGRQGQGLILTVEDADALLSPLEMEMVKIRIKVSRASLPVCLMWDMLTGQVHHGGHTRKWQSPQPTLTPI